jgi:hypothetical protein
MPNTMVRPQSNGIFLLLVLAFGNRSPGHFYCNYFDGGGPARQA